jgi:hypothetical protein
MTYPHTNQLHSRVWNNRHWITLYSNAIDQLGTLFYSQENINVWKLIIESLNGHSYVPLLTSHIQVIWSLHKNLEVHKYFYEILRNLKKEIIQIQHKKQFLQIQAG